MANCEINGEFTDQIPKWDRKTKADGNEMGDVIEKLINNDVNLRNREELMTGERQVTFSAAGWGDGPPYTQTVQVEGMKDTYKPIPMFVDDGTDEADSKSRKKSYGCISHFDSAEGSVTATCRFKKPTADCTVNFKGV